MINYKQLKVLLYYPSGNIYQEVGNEDLETDPQHQGRESVSNRLLFSFLAFFLLRYH